MRARIVAALGCCLALAQVAPAAAAESGAAAAKPEAEISLHPVRGQGEQVTAIEVSSVYRGELGGAADAFHLKAPIVYAGRTGMADAVHELVVQDADGRVPLGIADDPADPGGFPYYRHWRAERPVVAPVTVSYRVTPAAQPLRGPQFDFSAHGGGVSSGGMALFVLPQGLDASWRVRWDLDDLAPGAFAASTHGEGALELEGPGDRLVQAYYMAGPLGRFAAEDTNSSFHAYWLGRTRFDAPAEMAWTAEAYAYLRRFFRDDTTPAYRVFVRAVPAEQGLGGTALGNSFMVGVPEGDPEPGAQAPRGTLFHEMGHLFVGGLAGEPPGGAAWFAEGLNVHYTRLLLLRSGLAPVDDYLDSINSSARNYYSSPYRSASADELFRLGFSTGIGAGSAQNIAYTRGSLYFAAADARIRAASGGRRTLDDVILPLFEARRNGEALTREILLDALAAAAGESERTAFTEGIVDGALVVPPSEAFGPCFERQPATYDDGTEGYEWVRVESVADEECRRW